VRPSKDETWLEVCRVLARQSTCLRRQVGCVLLDRHGAILSTGWNGVAPEQPHCNEAVLGNHSFTDRGYVHPHNGTDEDVYVCERVGCGKTLYWAPRATDFADCPAVVSHPNACPGARAPSGTALDACRALHAEMNAVATCPRWYDLDVCYCTASPCVTCTKLLLRSPCRRVVFLEDYPAPGARELWEAAGRKWHMFTPGR